MTLDRILTEPHEYALTHQPGVLVFHTDPTRQDSHLQIFDPFTTLLELHRTGIVAEEHDVEQRDLDQVRSELFRQAPLLADPVQSARLGDPPGNLFQRLRLVKRFEVLLR